MALLLCCCAATAAAARACTDGSSSRCYIYLLFLFVRDWLLRFRLGQGGHGAARRVRKPAGLHRVPSGATHHHHGLRQRRVAAGCQRRGKRDDKVKVVYSDFTQCCKLEALIPFGCCVFSRGIRRRCCSFACRAKKGWLILFVSWVYLYFGGKQLMYSISFALGIYK